MDVDLKSESTLSDDVGHEAKVRVLSYNFNILPRGCGGYQHERIDTFLSAVDKYDVVLLQEVYATSIFPYALQKRFCYQKMLLDGLKAKGFPYYAISRQPSYQTMMRVGVVSDSGLVIASRFPIWHRGSYTFRHKSTRGDASAPKGCLFAEIEVPSKGTPSMNQRVLFFNVHMRPEESSPTHSSQVFQLKQCMKTVLGQLSYRNDDDTNSSFSNTPFVVSGDFNIHGIDANNAKLTTKLNDFMTELQSLGNVQDVVFCTLGTHLPTRPPNRFFPTQSRLEKYETTPQCQDYLLYNEAVLPIDARMEKFVVGSRRPYTYLSDHFGIATTIALNPAGQHALLPRSPSRLQLPSFVESAHHELSNPSSNVHMEVFLASIVAWLALSANWLQVCIIAIAAAIFQYTRYRTTTRVIFSRRAPIVTDEVVAGRAETTIPTTGASSKSAEVSGRQYASLQEMWLHAVSSFRGSPCIGSAREVGSVEWMSFDAVDKRARHFGAGLAALGLTAGSLIGVECEASEDAAILDLACILYGYVTVPLSGKRTTIRTLLDQHNIHVVFAGRSSVPILLNCRSTSLETVITVGSTLDEEDVQQAVGLSITLIPSSSVELKGRSAARPAFPRLTDATLFSMTMDNVSTSDLLNLVPVTHGDVLRDLEVLRRTEVLPDGSVKERMLWYSPFASLFNRMCVFGLLSYGHSVATSDSSHLQETLERVQPTLLVASPSLFSTSYVQHRRSKDRGYRLPRWLADRVFQLRSYLIFVQGRDSEILRYLFFRSFAQQLGGAVRRIVLNTAQESTPFYLVEHIAVCYAPVVREVSYLHTVGVCTIDGAPAPNLRVQLRCFNELSEKSGLGELVIHRDEKEQLLEVAAKWETTDRTLTFLGPPQGVLWPVEYEYAIASELERSFASSRYVNDVFVHCDALKPIIVVVNPNRDTVEFEWMQEHDQSKGNKALSWTDLVHYATDVIMEDLKCIAAEQKLHPSQIPSLVHLHPHAFRDHLTFLTPYGKIRRGDVSRYFASVFSRLYEDGGNSVSPGLTDDNLSEGECSTSSHPLERKLRELRVPITIDIGGTFAKITYITPPGAHDLKLPTFFVREASSLSERLGVRSFRFFRDREAAEKELQQNPKSRTGTLHFAKIPSSQIPQMAEFLAREQLVHTYKDECVQSIRATGGGAFKYANLARRTLGVKLEVVKEMDAVIKGLNLIIQLAAESIFTVEPTTGTHLPHKLVSSGDGFSPFPYLVFNMGSGISFIKCLGPDGSHVRVGGSPIGGATFWGLIRKMTSLTSWEEVMEIMRLDGPGDNKNVDLLVGDIYGYNAKDLPAMLSCETVASSFGKFGVDRRLSEVPRTASEHFAAEDNGVVLSPRSNPTNRTFSVNAEAAVGNATSIDIVRSLLNMIAVNVTQLAYLHSRVHGVRNVFFTGGFVRDNPIVWSLISTAMQYWSGGEYHAHFLEHDGYLGALGCAVLNTEDEA